MKIYYKYSLCGILTAMMSPIMGQDLLGDMKNVAEKYASLSNYSIAWTMAMTGTTQESDHVQLKRCGDKYFVSGHGQIALIDNTRSVTVYPEMQIMLYADVPSGVQDFNPMQEVTAIIGNAQNIKLATQNGSTRHYQIYTRNGIIEFELWINTAQWRVQKIIQHAPSDPGTSIVYELTRFREDCESGDEMHITSYVAIDQSGEVRPAPKYRDYTLHMVNDQMQGR